MNSDWRDISSAIYFSPGSHQTDGWKTIFCPSWKYYWLFISPGSLEIHSITLSLGMMLAAWQRQPHVPSFRVAHVYFFHIWSKLGSNCTHQEISCWSADGGCLNYDPVRQWQSPVTPRLALQKATGFFTVKHPSGLRAANVTVCNQSVFRNVRFIANL